MKKQRNNRGFVLLLILAVLLIASTVLAGWAYRLSSGALVSGEIARDIQRKWAVISCREVFLNLNTREDFSKLLAEESEENQEVVASVAREIELNGILFKIILSDEQAKANVNSLIKNDPQQAAGQISKLISDIEESYEITVKAINNSTEYNSYDQIFDYKKNPENLFNSIFRVTCWGDGLVNIMRADEMTLGVATDGILSEGDIQTILSLRDENSEITLDEVLGKLELENEDKDKLKKILTDSSNCRSLWVVCNDGNRGWYFLYVAEEASEDDSLEHWSYQW